MFRRLIEALGFRIVYVCEWGRYDHRYSGIDFNMCRPIHPQMSVAPPWAKRKIERHVTKLESN
jgi:hypothetical protein